MVQRAARDEIMDFVRGWSEKTDLRQGGRVVRWGVAGCGDVVDKHVGPAMLRASGCRILSFLTRDPEKGRRYAARFAAERVFTSINEFLSDPDTDAVYIALPVFLHREMAERAAAAGKHVLCEKPMAMNGGECESMIRACRSAGVRLGVAYYRRFFPQVRKIGDLLEEGGVGKIIHVESRFTTGGFGLGCPVSEPWRLDPEKGGGGILQDVGSHRIDLVLYLCGGVETVSACVEARRQGWLVDDTVTAWLRLRSGAHASLFFACNTKARVDAFEILGTEGRIWVDDLRNGRRVFLERDGAVTVFEVEARESHRPLIEDFIGAVREGWDPPVSGEEGARATRVIDAFYISSSGVRGVSLNGGAPAGGPTEYSPGP